MTTTRAATKSPLAVARTALAVARDALPAYSSKFSRKDFTQHQLFALSALQQFLGTDYRGLAAHLADWSDLRAALGLAEVPHFTTAQKALARLETPSGRRAGGTPGLRREGILSA